MVFLYSLIGRYNSKHFLKTDCTNSKSHKVFFEDRNGGRIKFDGCPYIILGRKVYDCQHGVDRHANEKKRDKDKKMVSRKKNESELKKLNILVNYRNYFNQTG